jgi:hypothetical protein
MSESAGRLARELCGIWFKTVDAIIVRRTQPRRLPPAAQDHAIVNAGGINSCSSLLYGFPSRLVTVSAAPAHLVAAYLIGTVSMLWLSFGSAALGMGFRKCGPA